MSFDTDVIVIINLSIMVLALLGFIYHQLESSKRIKARLDKRIKQLQELLETNGALNSDEPPLSHQKRQQTQKIFNELSIQQMDVMDSMLDIEQAIEKNKERDLKQLQHSVNLLKSQSLHAQKLIETLKADSSASIHRQNILESNLEKKSKRLKKAVSINNELKEHYQKIAAAYKATVKKVGILQESKEQLEFTISENARLSSQMSEFQAMHQQQSLEVEELKKINQTQSDDPSEDPSDEASTDFDAQLQEIQQQLARSEKERNLLESQFLEVVGSLDKKEVIEEELNRSKKEYSLLEDRFIELSEIEEQQRSN